MHSLLKLKIVSIKLLQQEAWFPIGQTHHPIFLLTVLTEQVIPSLYSNVSCFALPRLETLAMTVSLKWRPLAPTHALASQDVLVHPTWHLCGFPSFWKGPFPWEAFLKGLLHKHKLRPKESFNSLKIYVQVPS